MKHFVFHCFAQQPRFTKGFDRFEALSQSVGVFNAFFSPVCKGGTTLGELI